MVVINNETTQKIKEEIGASIRDLLSMKVTLPLGNPAFKHVHTNQFCWIDLPEEFELENMEMISKYMTSSAAARSGYVKGRWYIESSTITNDGNKFTIELGLNPFASSVRKFRDARVAYEEAYTDTKSTGTSTSVSSVSGNKTLKGGQGSTIDNLVKNIVGAETGDLKKAQLIHEWLRKNVIYSYYECSKYKTPEKCYNNRNHLNCADTAILTCSMMLSAGLNAYIVHRPYNGGHFWTIIEINGKKYASDQTGRESASMAGSAWNTVWSRSGRANTSITNYGHRESGLNTC